MLYNIRDGCHGGKPPSPPATLFLGMDQIAVDRVRHQLDAAAKAARDRCCSARAGVARHNEFTGRPDPCRHRLDRPADVFLGILRGNDDGDGV